MVSANGRFLCCGISRRWLLRVTWIVSLTAMISASIATVRAQASDPHLPAQNAASASGTPGMASLSAPVADAELSSGSASGQMAHSGIAARQIGSATAQQNGTVAKPSSPVKSNGRASDGIQVSGYWKIDVRNPDGKLVKHVEFENSLNQSTGSYLLTDLLQGAFPAEGPTIILSGAGLNSSGAYGFGQTVQGTAFDVPFDYISLQPNGICGYDCLISQTGSVAQSNCSALATDGLFNYSSATCVPGLSVSGVVGSSLPIGPLNPTSIGSNNQLTLTAQVTATQTANVGGVGTMFTIQWTGILAFPGYNSNSNLNFAAFPLMLTGYVLPTPVTVQQGQVVNVSVTLSFSSPTTTSSGS